MRTFLHKKPEIPAFETQRIFQIWCIASIGLMIGATHNTFLENGGLTFIILLMIVMLLPVPILIKLKRPSFASLYLVTALLCVLFVLA